MHNNIMASGLRDRPPLLATGRYPQWRSWFLRYIDTRPNGDALKKCILNGPYIPTNVLVQAPEWLMFVTIVKQQHKLDEVSYHNLFDILKQYQKEVNELCAKRLARNAKPLALVATAQANQDPYYQTSNNTCIVEMDDSNVILDSPDMCDDDIQNDQNDVECDDESVALVNLIANLKLDVDENKKIQNQLKKANITLAQELKEYKTILVETSKTLRESNSVRDSCLVVLQNKQAEFEKYKAFNDRTVAYDKLERKLNESLGRLA
nr:hypothetical protein [Tanacetum cinerariifolium]